MLRFRTLVLPQSPISETLLVVQHVNDTGYSVSKSVRPCDLSALSPYLIPSSLGHKKKVNIGDGIILRAIERFVGPLSRESIISPRIAPTREQLEVIDRSKCVLIAGANQLNDNYSIWPGLTLEQLKRTRVPFIPFGVGIHGGEGHTNGLSENSRAILECMHERIEYSSWRCPATVAYLSRALPHLAHKFLMTGCPVLYDRPLLEGRGFTDRIKRIAVTITERDDFMRRETTLLSRVAKQFPKSERYLVLHQNFSPPTRYEALSHRLLRGHMFKQNEYQKLRMHARQLGFRIVIPRDADECIQFYHGVDAHMGSRLHAHLLCLSLAKRSALIAVDGRAPGIAEFFGFPLFTADNITDGLAADFEHIRGRAQFGFRTMESFLSSLPR